jgi:hypothetical protein
MSWLWISTTKAWRLWGITKCVDCLFRRIWLSNGFLDRDTLVPLCFLSEIVWRFGVCGPFSPLIEELP